MVQSSCSTVTATSQAKLLRSSLQESSPQCRGEKSHGFRQCGLKTGSGCSAKGQREMHLFASAFCFMLCVLLRDKNSLLSFFGP